MTRLSHASSLACPSPPPPPPVQALDIAALKKITAHTLVMIVSVFGFMVTGPLIKPVETDPFRGGVWVLYGRV